LVKDRNPPTSAVRYIRHEGQLWVTGGGELIADPQPVCIHLRKNSHPAEPNEELVWLIRRQLEPGAHSAICRCASISR